MNSTAGISVTFLEDGAQSPEQVAPQLTGFFDGATQSIDIAIYDCGLTGDVAGAVARSLDAAAQRGVAVRLAYYSGPHRMPGVAPPAGSSRAFAESLGIPVRPVTGFRALMHQKYVVRDAGTPSAEVWTGSTNWTVDAFAREENIIIRLPSQEIAGLYHADFQELWSVGNVDNSGARDGGGATLSFDGALAPTRVWFSPGQGLEMTNAVAVEVTGARKRIVIASPVLTVGTILGALADVVHHGQVPLRGVYDWTQMQEVRHQWGGEPQAAWKIQAFDGIVHAAHMAGKHSTPFAPGSVHDYMHMKVIVVDDTVFTGSYNFSHSGEENAENLVRVDSPELADACVQFIEKLIARYGSAGQAFDIGKQTN